MLNQCSILLNAIVNATNNNDYFIDVTNLGLHNKDSTLVTQASIFSYIYIYILYCDRTQDPVRSQGTLSQYSPMQFMPQPLQLKVKAKATTNNNN